MIQEKKKAASAIGSGSRLRPPGAEPHAAVEFGPELCQALDAATSREWLETNGLGSFASSTGAGLNPRRYHGLLVAALAPATGRFVLLSQPEEPLVVDGQ